MKSFKRIVAEVAQPKGEDEIDFKAKHEIELIDEPNAEESQFDGGTKKTKPRKADYVDGEDEDVYEAFAENLYEAAAKGPFTWEQINTAMMTAGFNPPQILKLLSALNKTVKEDVSDIQELSKATLKSYVKKSLHNTKLNDRWGDRKDMEKADSRRVGISKAVDRLAKEDVDQLDELSADTLKNYVSAAVKSAARSRGKGTAQRNKFNRYAAKNEDTDLEEAVGPKRKLDKANIVHSHHPAAVQFAKEYHAAHAGDYRSGGPQGKDEANSEKFHATYDSKHTRHGFGGSGTTVYKHKQTGHEYEVDRVPNGKGFYGTDHHVDIHSSKHEDVSENLDEAAAFASGTVKFGDGKTGNVKEQDASILNTLYAKLKKEGAGSHEEMHKHAMENQKNFAAVVEFAIATVGKK